MLHSIDGHLTTGKVVSVSCSSCVAVVLQLCCSRVAVMLHLLWLQACKHMAHLMAITQTGSQTKGVPHMKDSPSKNSDGAATSGSRRGHLQI